MSKKNMYEDVTSFFWELLYDIVHLDYETLQESERFMYFQTILDKKFMLYVGDDILFFDTVEELFEETYSYLVEFRPDMKEYIYYLEKALKMIEIFTMTSSLADELELKL